MMKTRISNMAGHKAEVRHDRSHQLVTKWSQSSGEMIFVIRHWSDIMTICYANNNNDNYIMTLPLGTPR